MWNENEASQAIGKTVYSGEGEKIGKVGQVFLGDQTGRPEFLTVNTGLFGIERVVRARVEGASINGNDISVPYGKDTVKAAPRVDLDGDHLERGQRASALRGRRPWVRRHGNGSADASVDDRENAYAGDPSSEGHDTSGPNTDDAMTRSEEHLNVGTTSQPAGRARLRKYVTTENETVTVPVHKEKAVLETEPSPRRTSTTPPRARRSPRRSTRWS